MRLNPHNGSFLIPVVPSPAQAQTDLERVVGRISPADRALLPHNSKLWGTYQRAATPDLCRNGSIRCVDAMIALMYQRFNPLAASCHHNAVFSLLYLRVTEKYKSVSITPGFFQYPATVNKEDTDFARLYIRAYDDWRANRPGGVGPVWRLSFAAADAKMASGTGDALLGMISHIKRDLPFALWRIAMGSRADHLKINEMLKQVYPSVSRELHDRFDPLISPDGGRVPGTNVLVVDAIATWRDQAWEDARSLLAARNAAAFDAVAQRIEKSAWDYGLSIYRSTRYVSDVQRSQRYAYCQTHGTGG